MPKQLSIIIVNWNTGPLLTACVRSLAALPDDERRLIHNIVIVDNASTDDSLAPAKQVAASLPLHIVVLPNNIGFAQANNVALEQLPKPPGSHVLLLNPDTEVKPGALLALMAALEREPNVGVVGPHLLNADGSTQPSVRRFPSLGALVFLTLKLHHIFPHARLWQSYLQTDFDYAHANTVDQVMGAAMLIRDTALTSIGTLDPALQWWFDDVDYCKRAVANGWLVLYQPAAEIIHHGGVSFAQLAGFTRTRRFLLCLRRYARKHASGGAWIVVALLSPIGLVLGLISSVL